MCGTTKPKKNRSATWRSSARCAAAKPRLAWSFQSHALCSGGEPFLPKTGHRRILKHAGFPRSARSSSSRLAIPRFLISVNSVLSIFLQQLKLRTFRKDKDSVRGPLFSYHRGQQPFPQHHQVIRFSIAKHDAHAQFLPAIDNACLCFKELGRGKKFYRQGRADRIMVFRIHIATVQAEFFDARGPLVFGRAFAHFDGSNERIPGTAAPILFHGTPGENRDDSTPAFPNFLKISHSNCSTSHNLTETFSRFSAYCPGEARPKWKSNPLITVTAAGVTADGWSSSNLPSWSASTLPADITSSRLALPRISSSYHPFPFPFPAHNEPRSPS